MSEGGLLGAIVGGKAKVAPELANRGQVAVGVPIEATEPKPQIPTKANVEVPVVEPKPASTGIVQSPWEQAAKNKELPLKIIK